MISMNSCHSRKLSDVEIAQERVTNKILNNIVENTMMKAKWEVLSNMQTYSGFKVTGDTVDDSENAILYGYDGEEYQLKTILEEKKEKTKQYKITNKKC